MLIAPTDNKSAMFLLLTLFTATDNDVDSMGEPFSNRGNKLKRKAAFTQEGRLNNTENYKRVCSAVKSEAASKKNIDIQ